MGKRRVFAGRSAPDRPCCRWADAHAVCVDLVAAESVFNTDVKVAGAGAQMDVKPVPSVAIIANAVIEKLLVCGDSPPAAVVEGGRSVGGVVAWGEEPVGAERDAFTELGCVDVTRVVARWPIRLGTDERAAGDGEEQTDCGAKRAGKHRDHYSLAEMR